MAALTDRVALITGSTSGIGQGIAQHFAELGARVVVHGLEVEAGERLVGALHAAGRDAVFIGGDLADEAACRALVRGTLDRYGTLDILVNNAASTSRATLEGTTVAFWDRMMAINLRAPFVLTQEAVAPMKARGGGSIVNIGSINAYIGQDNLLPYSVSKGGLMTLTRNNALALRGHRIRVNGVPHAAGDVRGVAVVVDRHRAIGKQAGIVLSAGAADWISDERKTLWSGGTTELPYD